MSARSEKSVHTALVTTTINIPVALDSYVAHFKQDGPGELSVIVIGDKKTPAEACRWVESREWGGVSKTYFGVEEQEVWLKRFRSLAKSLPWNSVQRRNLAYLIAAERGADRIITVDDDNYATDDNFFEGHGNVGEVCDVDEVFSPSGWFDIGAMLCTEPAIHVPPRGYPASRRHQPCDAQLRRRRARVVVNAGLWLGEPDIDAVTRLVTPVSVTGPSDRWPMPLALAKKTFCPFNSQNTAFAVDLLPCIYLIVMGTAYRGMRVGRFDDIWMSYFTKVIVDHMGDAVTFGRPWVKQDRNVHDVLEDLAGEVPAMILTERLMPALERISLSETSYLGCYFELIDLLRLEFSDSRRHPAEDRRYWNEVLDGMAVWAETCRALCGSRGVDQTVAVAGGTAHMKSVL
jgi:hypothetical protein